MVISENFLSELVALASDSSAQSALDSQLRAWLDASDVARARVFALLDDANLGGAVSVLAGFAEGDDP